MRIIYDAGHGGKDPGAEGNGSKESDITLRLVLELEKLTKDKHPEWTIVLTRDHDIYLSPGTRQRMAMAAKADAFVSIHCNAVDSLQANGCEVIYREDSEYDLALYIKEAIIAAYPDLRDRGNPKSDINDLGRSLAVLSTPNLPSVIVEPGFITNEKDFVVLNDTANLAGAILMGIEKWKELS